MRLCFHLYKLMSCKGIQRTCNTTFRLEAFASWFWQGDFWQGKKDKNRSFIFCLSNKCMTAILQSAFAMATLIKIKWRGGKGGPPLWIMHLWNGETGFLNDRFGLSVVTIHSSPASGSWTCSVPFSQASQEFLLLKRGRANMLDSGLWEFSVWMPSGCMLIEC